MTPEPPRALLDLPDGRTVEVRVLLQQRVGDRWRCQVEWSEGPGATYYPRALGRGVEATSDRGPDESGPIRVMPAA
jgi:hypothetical protein